VIAEREYRLVTKARKRQKVLLQFGKPRRSQQAGDYYCGFHIHGLEERAGKPRFIYGADAVQALFLAMQMALNELLWTQAYGEGRLTLDGFFDLGLPVMRAADRRRIKKDPRAERFKREIGAQVAGVMRPRGRPGARGRDTTTGRSRR
jgi:hypothetical protein